MAVNRYMKPAEQPLLDTYVPLPFKEMSMAYATKQKEHNEAEELAGSLDDDILKVRASTPLHVRELGNIRTNLDNDLLYLSIIKFIFFSTLIITATLILNAYRGVPLTIIILLSICIYIL